VPQLEADPSVKAPDPEILESIIEKYFTLDAEKQEIETKMELQKKIIETHCKSSGQETVLDPAQTGKKLTYSCKLNYIFNTEYLMEKMGGDYSRVVVPQMNLLKKAVDEGIIDGTTFEKSREVDSKTWSLKIYRPRKKKED